MAKGNNNDLTPIRSILFANIVGVEEIPAKKVTIEQVGEKAFGLSCLPSFWVPPFFVISSQFFEQMKHEGNVSSIVQKWLPLVAGCLKSLNFPESGGIYIRSSVFISILTTSEFPTK